MNKKSFFILILMLISVILISGCINSKAVYSSDDATQLAKLVMEGAPMYKFDGFDLNLVNVVQLEKYKWQFDFSFKCKNEGYGNRAGEFVAHITTPHNSTLIVQNETVTYAVVDNVWDILNREFLEY